MVFIIPINQFENLLIGYGTIKKTKMKEDQMATLPDGVE